MYSSIRSICASLAAVVLAGCAAAPPSLPAPEAARYKRVAVISIAAGTFNRQYTGFTVFNNKKEATDISDWNVDAQYEAQLAQAVSGVPGLTAAPASFRRADFLPAIARSQALFQSAFATPDWQAIEGPIRAQCSAQQLDGLLFLAPSAAGDFLGRTNQHFGGAGVYGGMGGPGGRISVLHLLATLYLVDCRTARPAAQSPVAAGANARRSALIRDVPIEIGHYPMPEWPAGARQDVERQLIALPLQAWQPTLTNLLPGAAR